jgi:predicted transcriptional regulator
MSRFAGRAPSAQHEAPAAGGRADGADSAGQSAAVGPHEVVGSTAKIIAAYVRNHPIEMDGLVSLIAAVGQASAVLNGAQPQDAPVTPRRPAVAIGRSVTDDYIVCLEDGLKFKSLKRHLQAKYGLTPDAYRRRWGLPAAYPMVAPGYAKSRSVIAKTLGLGGRGGRRQLNP